MRRPGGYATVVSPVKSIVQLDGLRCEEIPEGTFESDTFSCFHCGRITHVRPRMDPADMGGMCKICYQLICHKCVGHGCDPFEKKMERAEARERARRSYGI